MILEILFILTWGVGDVFSTWIFLKNGKKEGNPFIRFLLNKFGFVFLIILKVISILFILNAPFYNDISRIFIFSFAIVWGIILTIENLKGEEIVLKNLYRKYYDNSS